MLTQDMLFTIKQGAAIIPLANHDNYWQLFHVSGSLRQDHNNVDNSDDTERAIGRFAYVYISNSRIGSP